MHHTISSSSHGLPTAGCRKRQRRWLLFVPFLVLFGVLGTVTLLRSKAATPLAAVNVSTGSVAGGSAAVVNDTTAAGGKAVRFKQASGGGSSLKLLVPNTAWDWQIGNTNPSTTHIDASSNSKKMFDFDPFSASNTTSLIASLHSKNVTVVCYVDVGTYEPGRSDTSLLSPYKLNAVSGWPGEYWLNIKNPTVIGSGATKSLQDIMAARFDTAAADGCDGIEPDNIDGYDGNISSSYNVTAADQITYNTLIASLAHARSMSVGLKNDVSQISKLASVFDWALNEECHKYSECTDYPTYFTSQGKAVFNAEYTDDGYSASSFTSGVCPSSISGNIDAVLFNLDLDGTTYTSCR